MKNTVNRLALLLGVIAATTLSATAQGGPDKGERGRGGPGDRGGRPLSEEMRKEADTNKDGKVSDEERKAFGEKRRKAWEALTPEEREAKMKERRAEMEKRRAEFEKLTPEERKAQMEERMKKRFDKNEDGTLDDGEKEEMEKAMAEMQKRMKERGGRRGGPEGRSGPGRGERKPKGGEGGEKKEG